MGRNTLFGLGAAGLAVVLVFAAYQTARARAAEEIHRVEQEAATLRAQRDSIIAVAALRDSLSAEIRGVADSLGLEVDAVRRDIAQAEEERAEAQLDVWLLRSEDDVERRFREAFPEFASSMRVTEQAPEPGLLPLRYLMVPFQTARSFVTYRQNSESFEAQRDAFAAIDSMNMEIQSLQDSIIVLSEANEAAYRQGYADTFDRYTALSDDYVACLRRPRLDFGNKWGYMAAGGVGVALGVLVGQ